MKIITCEQRSGQWWEAKRGLPSASNFSRIITVKGDRSRQYESYLYELAAERISTHREETYISAAMQAGIEREDLSRRIYEMHYEVEVKQVGFCLSDCGRYGCSPDGLVGEGLLELKNPLGKTQVEYLLAGSLPSAYVQQVQGGLLVTGAPWCDFVSYYPGLPLFVVRVEPDQEFQLRLKRWLFAFCDELNEICRKLTDVP